MSDLLAAEGYRLVASFNMTPTMLFAHEADSRVAADAQTLARSFGNAVMKAYRAELARSAERRRAADLAAELEQAKLRLGAASQGQAAPLGSVGTLPGRHGEGEAAQALAGPPGRAGPDGAAAPEASA